MGLPRPIMHFPLPPQNEGHHPHPSPCGPGSIARARSGLEIAQLAIRQIGDLRMRLARRCTPCMWSSCTLRNRPRQKEQQRRHGLKLPRAWAHLRVSAALHVPLSPAHTWRSTDDEVHSRAGQPRNRGVALRRVDDAARGWVVVAAGQARPRGRPRRCDEAGSTKRDVSTARNGGEGRSYAMPVPGSTCHKSLEANPRERERDKERAHRSVVAPRSSERKSASSVTRPARTIR
eukprot:3665808-Rhodomonas_salina.2